MKIRVLLSSILACLLLVSCAQAKTPTAGVVPPMNAGPVSDNVAVPMAESFPGEREETAPESIAPQKSGSPAAEKRIVIYNADLTIVVDDPAKTMDEISKMTASTGGFIVSSRLFKTKTEKGIEVPQATLTVRIPAEQLNPFMGKIKAMVSDPQKDILTENVSGQDVTKEFTDLQSRLTNKEQVETQLKAILDKAEKTEDVLAVQQELSRVSEEIEVIKGEIKYYNEASAKSALTITLYTHEAVAPLTIGGWEPVGVARDAIQATINGLKFLANFLIWLVLFVLPIGLVIALPIWVIIMLIRRREKKNKQKQIKSDTIQETKS